MTGLDFGVLGPLQMSVDGAPVPLGTPKQRAVLAMLVMSRNRPVSSDVAGHTRPGSSSRRPEPKASLHSYISNLRRLVSSAGHDPSTVLASAPPGYRLTVTDADCDIGRFVAHKTAGVQAAAAGQFEQASGHLQNALAEWRGPVLDDLRDFEFVDSLRHRAGRGQGRHAHRARGGRDRLQPWLRGHRGAWRPWSPNTRTASRCGPS